ncbi:hypothetical protein BDN72DRAFT_97843 [Pluteus cervinus]|uniref:Uncharacterized protein n=1 Tax=Pluteus cervinus TaxID=181527 RepID=A0ACD3AQ18_9AGAR|nr:hypothetical protein BDN72DRAFT_97843 [Pluteus cervinus]
MSHDLHLDGLKYNIVAAIFFIPYAFAEVSSDNVLKLVAITEHIFKAASTRVFSDHFTPSPFSRLQLPTIWVIRPPILSSLLFLPSFVDILSQS